MKLHINTHTYYTVNHTLMDCSRYYVTDASPPPPPLLVISGKESNTNEVAPNSKLCTVI